MSASTQGRTPSHVVALDPPSAARSGSEPAATLPIALSVIMPTVFWSGTFERCARRLLSQLAQAKTAVEVVFVFDGKAPPTPAWLDQPGVTVVTTGVRSGPAIARNLAARSARGNTAKNFHSFLSRKRAMSTRDSFEWTTAIQDIQLHAPHHLRHDPAEADTADATNYERRACRDGREFSLCSR